MSESLYSQIAAAEDALRSTEGTLARANQIRDALAGIVGRAETADGHVVVECTSGEGITTLALDPRAMRMASADLAAAIKATIAEANVDLRNRIQRAMVEVGSTGARLSPEQVREQLSATQQKFLAAARTAAGGLADAERKLNDRGHQNLP